MNDTTAMVQCDGGCGVGVAGPGDLCGRCERFAQFYDGEECKSRLREIFARRDERLAQRERQRAEGLVRTRPGAPIRRFLGWNTRPRQDIESLTAPASGDPARRSVLMAMLPRVVAEVEEPIETEPREDSFEWFVGLNRWDWFRLLLMAACAGSFVAIFLCGVSVVGKWIFSFFRG